MKKTFKYRLYTNKRTFNKAGYWLGLCRNLYNVALEQRILAYKQNKKSLSYFSQSNEMPALKKEIPEYKDINAQTLRESLQRLDFAFRRFYTRVKNGEKPGFPRFKGVNRYNSFNLLQNGWRLEGKYLTITKLGRFKLRLSRPIEGSIRTITIYRNVMDKWYACFNCDNVPERKLPASDKEIGLDVGIKSFCVDSEGNRTDNPLYLRQVEAILRRKQRRLSRREKGSNRRGKARLLVAKCHEKITNQRNDFLHKAANYYIENYGTIYIEDLRITNMVRNHHLAKSISDSSWGKFFGFLSYKAEEAGRTVVRVNPAGTSQICSRCGTKVEKTLADRIHDCPVCGLIVDRDLNSAIDVLQAGQACQALTKEVALCVA